MIALAEDVQVCVVSGGTRGLGRAIAADLLAAGCTVATFGRTHTTFVEHALAEHGARFSWDEVDAADPAQVARFGAAVAKRHGRIDALVNNVGVMVEGMLTLTRLTDLHRALAVNLESAIVLSQACTKVMLRQHRGRIVNISSVNAVRGHRGVTAYSAAKAGLDGFTRSLARELGGRGIRVNSIAPGYLDTEMTTAMSQDQRQQIVRRTPLERLGNVDDVVGVVRFLLSPEAGFVTGQTLVVDGGLTC
jgi:3-oxoacyl-[acyl-carrier protein] reductase